MKICLAQTQPMKGDLSANIKAHIKCIELALTLHVDAIFFPELSLTGYEPELAKELATTVDDNRLAIFQQLSDKNNILIGFGLPTVISSKIQISMIFFERNKPIQIYSKQQLHSDEFPYFEKGMEQIILETGGKHIAPAICYESLQSSHAEHAFKLGADVYLASVAKPAKSVYNAYDHYPKIAKQYDMPVLMVNSVGFCDNFLSVGKSAAWTRNGLLAGQLDNITEGILIFNTETEETISRKI